MRIALEAGIPRAVERVNISRIWNMVYRTSTDAQMVALDA